MHANAILRRRAALVKLNTFRVKRSKKIGFQESKLTVPLTPLTLNFVLVYDCPLLSFSCHCFGACCVVCSPVVPNTITEAAAKAYYPNALVSHIEGRFKEKPGFKELSEYTGWVRCSHLGRVPNRTFSLDFVVLMASDHRTAGQRSWKHGIKYGPLRRVLFPLFQLLRNSMSLTGS